MKPPIAHPRNPPIAVPTPGAATVPAAAPPAPRTLHPAAAPAQPETTWMLRRRGWVEVTIEYASTATPTTTSVRPENLYIFAARPRSCSPTPTDVWFVI